MQRLIGKQSLPFNQRYTIDRCRFSQNSPPKQKWLKVLVRQNVQKTFQYFQVIKGDWIIQTCMSAVPRITSLMVEIYRSKVHQWQIILRFLDLIFRELRSSLLVTIVIVWFLLKLARKRSKGNSKKSQGKSQKSCFFPKKVLNWWLPPLQRFRNQKVNLGYSPI